MSRIFETLSKVKRLREEKAMRALELARRQLAEAEARRDGLAEECRVSAASLPERERAVFARILRQTVAVERIDAANAQVHALREAHRALLDALERAKDAAKRAADRLTEAQAALRQRQQDVQKIDIAASEELARLSAEAEAREELELEESAAGGLKLHLVEATA